MAINHPPNYDPNKVYPQATDTPDMSAGSFNLDNAAKHAIHSHESGFRVASKKPEVRQMGLLILLLAVASICGQIITIGTQIAFSENTPFSAREFLNRVEPVTLAGIAALIIIGYLLLATTKPQIVRVIIIGAGLVTIASAINSLLHFDPIGAGLNAYITWKLFELFQEV